MPHLSPKVALQNSILLERVREGRLHNVLLVCDRRFRRDTAEDEGRGEAARVPADGDTADLDPGGVEAGDQLRIHLLQYPATRIHGETAHRMRYVRCDLHGHEGREMQRSEETRP